MEFWDIPKEEILENVEKYNAAWKKQKAKNTLLAGIFAAGLIALYVWLRLFNTGFVENQYGDLELQYSTAWVVNCPANHPCFEGKEEKKVNVDFDRCPNVRRLNVEEGITYITCSSKSKFLKTLSLPSSLASVWGFGGCSNLETIIWEKAPEGAIIGSEAFANTGIKEIVIPEGVAIIGNEAFAWNDNLTKVTLSNTVNCMNGEVFENCTNLQEVTWSNSLYYMPDETFVNCENLTVLNNTDNIRSITYSALTGTQITSDQLPDNVHCFGADEFTFSDYEANKWLIDYSYTFNPDEEIAFLAQLHDLPIELFQMKAEDGMVWLDGKYYTFDMNLEEFMANGNWEVERMKVSGENSSICYYDLINQESGNTVDVTVCEDEIVSYRFYSDCRVMLPDGVNNFGMSSARIPYLYGAEEYTWEYEGKTGTEKVEVSQSWNYGDREDYCFLYIDKEISSG